MEKPIVTNARGMYSGYQRLFLACGDYDRDLNEPETVREKSLTIRVGGQA